MPRKLHVIFAQMKEASQELNFVEVEDDLGASVGVGKWEQHLADNPETSSDLVQLTLTAADFLEPGEFIVTEADLLLVRMGIGMALQDARRNVDQLLAKAGDPVPEGAEVCAGCGNVLGEGESRVCNACRPGALAAIPLPPSRCHDHLPIPQPGTRVVADGRSIVGGMFHAGTVERIVEAINDTVLVSVLLDGCDEPETFDIRALTLPA